MNTLLLGRLSPRQKQVIDLVAQGLANKEIARRLDISPRTAEIHRSQAIHRSGTRTTYELISAMHAAEVAELKAEITRLTAIIADQDAAQ